MPTTMRTPSRRHRSTTAAEKARHSWSGSGPCNTSTSCSAVDSKRKTSRVGHSSRLLTPSTRCSVGRRARWSSSRSVSKRAIRRPCSPSSMCCRATRAAPDASIHPSIANSRTGSASNGVSMISSSSEPDSSPMVRTPSAIGRLPRGQSERHRLPAGRKGSPDEDRSGRP